jgi:hypothetical protein
MSRVSLYIKIKPALDFNETSSDSSQLQGHLQLSYINRKGVLHTTTQKNRI